MEDNEEKVLKGLEKCIADDYYNDCPYEGICSESDQDIGTALMADALELLEEQQETITILQSTISKLYALLDDVCKEFRERTEEDYVCGLCQYDGAYKGNSGDWCNECPGFESADCFTMKNEIRKMCGKDLLPEP